MTERMRTMNKALKYACDACDTLMRKFTVETLPPKKHFHYHQGVFLSGMHKTYKLSKDEKYFNYIRDWVNYIIDENGNIDIFESYMLDDIQPGILLYDLYRTIGDKRYKIALDYLISILREWKKNQYGGFWHKEIHPNQMWLDSIYMAGPIMAEYGMTFDAPELTEEAADQALIMNEHMLNAKTGLYYHAWDASKEIDWADKETGLSDECWGRALGWYAVATLDIIELMSEDNPKRKKLIEIEAKLLKSIAKYQDEESGMWYQVVDKGDVDGNWLETSCSCLFVNAIKRAVDMGIIDKEYYEVAEKGFLGVEKILKYDGDDLILNGVCVGTGVCDYNKYISRPTCENDLHGVGAFLLMCTAMAGEET